MKPMVPDPEDIDVHYRNGAPRFAAEMRAARKKAEHEIVALANSQDKTPEQKVDRLIQVVHMLLAYGVIDTP